MASNQFVVFAIVALMVLPTIILAERHVVGDQSGWTVLFDYQSWVVDRVFRVGDELVFKYDPDQHNVVRVNATGFNDCIVPLGNIALNSGNDIITLVTPGMKWYICGAPGHCDRFNQKLAINVISNDEFNHGAPPPPPPPCAAYGVVISAGYQVVMAVMIAAAMIVVY